MARGIWAIALALLLLAVPVYALYPWTALVGDDEQDICQDYDYEHAVAVYGADLELLYGPRPGYVISLDDDEGVVSLSANKVLAAALLITSKVDSYDVQHVAFEGNGGEFPAGADYVILCMPWTDHDGPVAAFQELTFEEEQIEEIPEWSDAGTVLLVLAGVGLVAFGRR